MDWINAIIAGLFGVVLWLYGFFCGYVKDKKEVIEMHEEATELWRKANNALAEAKEKLDVARGIYKEVDARLELMKKMNEEGE